VERGGEGKESTTRGIGGTNYKMAQKS